MLDVVKSDFISNINISDSNELYNIINDVGWILMVISRLGTLVWQRISTLLAISNRKMREVLNYLTNGWLWKV